MLFQKVNLAVLSILAAVRSVSATDCATFTGCFLRNIDSGLETALTGNDLYQINNADRHDYSIVCDVDYSTGESDFIKFFYNDKVQDEFGDPRWMNGDSNAGAFINPVPYLSSCGTKMVKVQGHVWSQLCFEHHFVLEAQCDETPAPSSAITPQPTTVAPTGSPSLRPTTRTPTVAPLFHYSTRKPTAKPIITPTRKPSTKPSRAPIRKPTAKPVTKPTRKPTRRPVAPVPVAPSTSSCGGYCNWGPAGTAASSTCNGDVQGGSYCNESRSSCQVCGGRWCSKSCSQPVAPRPVAAPVPVQKPTGDSYECKLPPNTDKYSLITVGDATVGAHGMYKGMAIGGTLTDGTPKATSTVDRTKTLVGKLAPGANFHFNGGIAHGQSLPSSTYKHFSYLATHAVSSNKNGKKVIVLTRGGTFNLFDFNHGGQAYDRDNTIVIFNTSDDVTITKAPDGRQFGPSFIAPFSKVIVKGDAGFVDGFIMAKSFSTTGNNQGELQLHGDTYGGSFTCK